MIGPLSCIYYNNANASRIHKIYHFLGVSCVSFVCWFGSSVLMPFFLSPIFFLSVILDVPNVHTVVNGNWRKASRKERWYCVLGAVVVLCVCVCVYFGASYLDNSDRIYNFNAMHSLLLLACLRLFFLRSYFAFALRHQCTGLPEILQRLFLSVSLPPDPSDHV